MTMDQNQNQMNHTVVGSGTLVSNERLLGRMMERHLGCVVIPYLMRWVFTLMCSAAEQRGTERGMNAYEHDLALVQVIMVHLTDLAINT